MNFKKTGKRKQWINNLSGLLLTGLVLGSAGTAFAETRASVSGGEVAADGSWHGDGKVNITAGDSFTNDANVYSSLKYSAGMRVYMDGGELGGKLYGGWSESADAYSNRVEIMGGTVHGDVYGSWTNTTEARGNMVVLGKAATIGSLYGGYSASGKANSNILEVYGSVTAACGGYGELSANENKLLLGSGSIHSEGYYGYYRGGYSKSGSADGNEVTLDGTTDCFEVYGGYGATSASHNSITADSVKVGSFVIGGKVSSSKGRADYNRVTIVNSDFAATVYGGRGDAADGGCISANYNEVTLDNCRVQSVFASYAAEEARGNKLVINNSTITGEQIIAVYSRQRANYNSFTADGLSMSGGRIFGVQTNDEAVNNTMYLKHATTEVVTGVRKPYQTDGGFNASGNRLTITDSDVSELYGVSSGDTMEAVSIKDNELVVSKSRLKLVRLIPADSGTVENNTLRLVGKGGQYQDVIGGPIWVEEDVQGYNDVNAGGLQTAGNTLAVYGSSIRTGNIKGFNNIDFYLADVTKANDFIITAAPKSGEKMDLTGTAVAVKAVQSKLKEGDKIRLVKLDNDAELLYDGAGQGTVFNGSMSAIGYKLAVEKAMPSGTAALVMTVTAPDEDDFYYINGQACNFLDEVETNRKNVVETQANAAALVAEGADFMTG